MLTELESRLADVLGSRLPAPFTGRVRRRGADAPAGNGPVVRVGVDAIEPLDPDFGAVRAERVPGSNDARRVLRLGVTLKVSVEPAGGAGRLQELQAIDAIAYELQDPQMRTGARLTQPGDPGFLLDSLRVEASDFSAAAELRVRAQGLFWPVGVVGETGREIERLLVREFRLPVRLQVGGNLIAGGPEVPLQVQLGATGTMQLTAAGAELASFGAVALRLVDDAGDAGAGTLSGGDGGPQGSRIVAVTGGSASLGYLPPAQPAADQLVVSAFSNDRVGIELARFELTVAS
jgi:hypothetical protein